MRSVCLLCDISSVFCFIFSVTTVNNSLQHFFGKMLYLSHCKSLQHSRKGSASFHDLLKCISYLLIIMNNVYLLDTNVAALIDAPPANFIGSKSSTSSRPQHLRIIKPPNRMMAFCHERASFSINFWIISFVTLTFVLMVRLVSFSSRIIIILCDLIKSSLWTYQLNSISLLFLRNSNHLLLASSTNAGRLNFGPIGLWPTSPALENYFEGSNISYLIHQSLVISLNLTEMSVKFGKKIWKVRHDVFIYVRNENYQ